MSSKPLTKPKPAPLSPAEQQLLEAMVFTAEGELRREAERRTAEQAKDEEAR